MEGGGDNTVIVPGQVVYKKTFAQTQDLILSLLLLLLFLLKVLLTTRRAFLR